VALKGAQRKKQMVRIERLCVPVGYGLLQNPCAKRIS
jgi:hypothetical protein